MGNLPRQYFIMEQKAFKVFLISLLTIGFVLPVTGCSDDERDYPALPFQTATEGYSEREIAREFSMMQPSLEAFEELWKWSKWAVTERDQFWPAINIKAALCSQKTRCPKFCNELETYLRSKTLTGTREELFEPFGALSNEMWWISSFVMWDHETIPKFAYFTIDDFSWDEPEQLNGFDSEGNPIVIKRQEWIEGNVVLIRFRSTTIFDYQDPEWYR